MAFNVTQKKQNRSWTDLLVEKSEAAYQAVGERRQRTFRRMYMSVFVLFSASFLIYCSLFYIGAFYDMRSVIGSNQSARAVQAQKDVSQLKPETRRTLFSPFFDAFTLNRVYLRRNQSILATYSLPENVNMTLTIKQCKQMPVVEIFSCKFIGEQETHIRGKEQGFLKFTVSEPGFYYFKAEAVQLPRTELKLHHDFKVVWQRG